MLKMWLFSDDSGWTISMLNRYDYILKTDAKEMICVNVNCLCLFTWLQCGLRISCLSKWPALMGFALSLFPTLVSVRGLNNATLCP